MDADTIRNTLLGTPCAWRGPCPRDLRVDGPVYDRRRLVGTHPSVSLFRGRSSALPRDLAIKAYDDHSGRSDVEHWMRGEISVLDRLTASDYDQGTLAPPLRFASVEHRIVATDWVNGFSLRTVIRAGRVLPGLKGFALRTAGGWLREYHDAMGRETRHAEPTSLGPVPECYAPYQRILESVPGMIGAEPIEHSISHGDFSPQNLIVSRLRKRPVGIDFSDPVRTPVIFDLATFLLSRPTGLFVRGPGAFPDAGWDAVPEFRALMEGYCVRGGQPDSRAFSRQMLHEVLVRLVDVVQELAAPGMRAADAAYRRSEIERLQGIADIVARNLHA